LLIVAAVVLVLPSIAGLVPGAVQHALDAGGGSLSTLLKALASPNAASDIGAQIASSHALLDPSLSAYAPLHTLFAAVGVDWNVLHSNTHLPFEFAVWLPVALLPSPEWHAYWVAAMPFVLALSMRVLSVPARIAYPVALIFIVTPVGLFALVSTYPVSALALAGAWRYRDNAWISGICYAFLAGTRGIAAIMLAYPIVTRRWKSAIVTVAALAIMLATVVALEPGIVGDFLTLGRDAMAFNTARHDNLSVTTVFAMLGIPVVLAIVMIGAMVAIGLWRKQELFWLLAWASMALTPIAWSYSVAMAVPLAVVIWRLGRLGQLAVLIMALGVAVTTSYYGPSWLVFVVVSGLALVLVNPGTGMSIGEDAPDLALRTRVETTRS